MTLALLITAATGAWAQTETLLTTITPTDKDSYSETTPGVVTVTHDNNSFKDEYGWVWKSQPGSLTVVAKDGYTITRCVFSQPYDKAPVTVSTAPFKVNIIYNAEYETYICEGSDPEDGIMDGVASIEVYGYAPAAASGPEVTLSDDKSEASFKMPQYDVTATYTLKRDMSVDVAGEMADRIRIKKDGNDYQAVGADGNIDANAALPTVTDNLDANTPVDMTKDTDYTLTLQKQGDTEDSWTDVTAYSVGTFRYMITGTGNYSGEIYTAAFTLFEGYEVVVPAKEFITYYKDEPLYVEDEAAVLYTITSVSADQAVLSYKSDAMPSNTPMLVYNNSNETKTFLLIPCAEPDMAITVAPEFVGTLEATTIAASTDDQTNYAFNGKQFVWVKDALEVGPNKAWLSVNTGVPSARITIVFDDATKIANTNLTNLTNGDWYDLNGRKLNGMPTKKGIYIMNGRKVVVK